MTSRDSFQASGVSQLVMQFNRFQQFWYPFNHSAAGLKLG